MSAGFPKTRTELYGTVNQVGLCAPEQASFYLYYLYWMNWERVSVVGTVMIIQQGNIID